VSQPRFEDVLEQCIADLAGGRREIADLLAEWPDFAERLQPLLEAAVAMSAEPRITEQTPDPTRRAAFMAELRETPQQSPRWQPLRALSSIIGALSFAGPALGRAGVVASAAAVLAIAALAATLVLDQGTTTAYASTVSVFAGGVEQQTDSGWIAIADGDQLAEGVRLHTDSEGSALLTFLDGTTVGVEPDSELLIELARFGDSRRIHLQQFAGRLWNDVVADASDGSIYVVSTPDAVITAHGTLFETAVDADETVVNTIEGLVELEAGAEQVFVAPGEVGRAQRHRQLSPIERRASAQQALGLSVNAPYAAAIIAPDGKATGVRPDGVAFQQIAGAATARPNGGSQRLELHDPTPGIYRLLLRRIGEGDGEIVLTVGGNELRVPVERLGDAVEVQLRVTIENGKLRVQPINARALQAAEANADRERVIVTEAARQRALPLHAPIFGYAAPGGEGTGREGSRPSPRGEGATVQPGQRPDEEALRERREDLQEQARAKLRERLEQEGPGGLRDRLTPEQIERLRAQLSRDRNGDRTNEGGRKRD
jgi:ferric-dicitrate binding protein FerR (iron transport regulator)